MSRKLNAVLTRLFRREQRLVRRLDQLRRGRRVPWKGGQASADGDRARRAGAQAVKSMRRNGAAEPPGQRCRLAGMVGVWLARLLCVPEDHAEFIAAEAGDDVG